MTNRDIPDDIWMVRACFLYHDEYKECTSLRSRFHQKYIYGESLPCEHWKKDFDNCLKFRKTRDPAAAEAVIQSEKARKARRLAASRENNVWEYRRSPPEDWKKPLPDHLEKMKIPAVNLSESKTLCVIS